MADTNKPSTPVGQPEEQDALSGLNLEESDRLNHAAEIAAIQSEIRALTGQAITMPRRLLGVPIPFTARNVPRTTATEGGLTSTEAEGFIPSIIEHLFAASREPSIRRIQGTIRDRFHRILSERSAQGAVHSDRVSEPIVVGRALLDAVYEQIKETDLELIAANIVSKIPEVTIQHRLRRMKPAVAGAAPTPVEPPQLSLEAMKLLERLRKGNTNPAKVILAFSAAVDTHYVDPQVGAPFPALPADQTPRLDLRTSVLGIPEANQQVSRYLYRIAEAQTAYAAVSDEQMEFRDPGAYGGGPRGEGYGEHLKAVSRYQRASSLLRAIRTSVSNLDEYFRNNSTVVIPRGLQTYFNSPLGAPRRVQPILDQLVPSAGPNPTIPRSSETRDILAMALGGELGKVEDYKANAEKTDDDQGTSGPEACNKILTEYARRVGGIDGETAKKSLASLTGRVKAAEQGMREQRAELSTVEAAWDAKDQRKAFHKQHKGAERYRDILLSHLPGRSRIPGFHSQASDLFYRELNRTSCIGLPASSPMSEANSLDRLQTRYYALWYLTNILPPDDPKHLPLTAEVAAELTALRRSIVERIMRNVSVIMAKKGIDKLKKEDVEKMGLQGANIDDLPYNEIQDRLFAMLNEQTLQPGIQEKVNKKIDQAWGPLGKREEWSTWRKEKAKGMLTSTVTGNGVWYNPLTWPAKTVKAVATGNGSALNPLTWPVKSVKATVTGRGPWYNPLTWPVKLAKGVNTAVIQPWYNHLFHEKDSFI